MQESGRVATHRSSGVARPVRTVSAVVPVSQLAEGSLRMAWQKSAVERAVEGAMWVLMMVVVAEGEGAVERRHGRVAAAVVEVRMVMMEGAVRRDAGVRRRWRLRQGQRVSRATQAGQRQLRPAWRFSATDGGKKRLHCIAQRFD